LLPQVILEMSLSQKLPCLTYGVQASAVTVIRDQRNAGTQGRESPSSRGLRCRRTDDSLLSNVFQDGCPNLL
jgi:hypothetical protein